MMAIEMSQNVTKVFKKLKMTPNFIESVGSCRFGGQSTFFNRIIRVIGLNLAQIQGYIFVIYKTRPQLSPKKFVGLSTLIFFPKVKLSVKTKTDNRVCLLDYLMMKE